MDRYEKEKALDVKRKQIEDALEPIKQMFMPGTLFTLIIRHPAHPNSTMLLTEDNPEETIKAVSSFIVK